MTGLRLRPPSCRWPWFGSFAAAGGFVALAACALACTSSVSPSLAVAPTLLTFPWKGPLPPGTPTTCSGQTYLLVYGDAGNAGECSGGVIWLLCDGVTYDDYACMYPGATWTPAEAASSSGATQSTQTTGPGDAGSSTHATASDAGMASSGASDAGSSGTSSASTASSPASSASSSSSKGSASSSSASASSSSTAHPSSS